MKHFIIIFALLLGFTSCSENEKKVPTLELKDFKEKLSYTLGADHARQISESGDRNFDKYIVDEIVAGFKLGLKDEKSFDENCKSTMQKFFGGPQGSINEQYAKDGSNCIGKISGIFFSTGWKAKNAYEKIDLKFVVQGFKDGLTRADSIVPRNEQASIVQNFMADLNKQNGNAMLEKAKKNPNVLILPSGVVLETLNEGKGISPTKEDDVLAHYILMTSLGDTLQSSFKVVEQLKQPLQAFNLNGVVAGWQEGFPLMKKGGKYKLYLPFHLAYGEEGMFNPETQSYQIQPFESLVFYIELLNYGKAGSLTKK